MTHRDIVRIDHVTKEARLVPYRRAAQMIQGQLKRPDIALGLLDQGVPITCTFATYQRLDAYPDRARFAKLQRRKGFRV